MQEVLESLLFIIESKQDEDGITPETMQVLQEAQREVHEMSVYPWTLEEYDELSDRLSKITAKITAVTEKEK